MIRNSQYLNPGKWSIVCWALLLVWLCPSVFINLPIAPDLNDFGDERSSLGVTYEQTVLVGFPFGFIEVSSSQFGSSRVSKPTTRYFLERHLANILIALANLCALVYVVQTLIPKFSMKVLLWAVPTVSVVVLVFQISMGLEDQSLIPAILFLFYFFPTLSGILLLLVQALGMRARIDEQLITDK